MLPACRIKAIFNRHAIPVFVIFCAFSWHKSGGSGLRGHAQRDRTQARSLSYLRHPPSFLRPHTRSVFPMPSIHQLRLALNGRIPPCAKQAYLKLREFNSSVRALPDFLVLGAQKSGTTSLFNYLCQHPKVIGSVPKEIFYFCSHSEKDARWYRRHFPRQSVVRKRGAICGEATPISLYYSHAAKRAAELVPQAKLIVILREPAARAVSHYYHQLRAGVETRSIDEVFSAENITKWTAGECPDLQQRYYFSWSDYATGLKHWLAHYPREQLLVLEAEKMFTDVQATVDKACDFLALESFSLPTTQAFNTGTTKAEKPRNFKALQDAFTRQNSELQNLGFEMSWI